jgi:hypothetical protein
MGEDTIDFCKEIMINHTLIIILCLFLIVYIVINYSLISEGNIYGGNLPKTIIITGVIFLILYVFVIWEEDNSESMIQDEIEFIPKYKIVNKINIKDNTSELPREVQNKSQPDLIIKNKYNSKYVKENSSNKHENSSNKQENSNIFVSQKNKAKFGIKF